MGLSEIAKRMILVLGLIFFLLAAGSAVYYRSLACLPFVYGALLATACNVFKVILLDRAVKKTVSKDAASAANYLRLQQLLRFLLTGLVLVLAAFLPFLSLWGAAAGVLSYQVAALSLKYIPGEVAHK